MGKTSGINYKLQTSPDSFSQIKGVEGGSPKTPNVIVIKYERKIQSKVDYIYYALSQISYNSTFYEYDLEIIFC